MKFEELTLKQQEKVRTCRNADDLRRLAEEEGVELSDEQIEAISGGSWGGLVSCPVCGGSNVNLDSFTGLWACDGCGTRF
ncbi:MAG: hypothetical protein E7Z99_00515 [Coriobacteriaceae bacterium]|jgi:hypothetical protein|nr:hypothetical protein [Coriobacteriaceae bacterium]